MAENRATVEKLLAPTDIGLHVIDDPDVARLVIHHNHVVGSHLVPGLHVNVNELEDGVDAKIVLDEGVVIAKPVHLCFGMLPETGIQKINLDVEIGARAKIALQAHCVFPNAVDVQHLMDAVIKIGEGAEYTYFEKHIHSEHGGVKVVPRAKVELAKESRFKTEFELLKGRVGVIDIDYETVCAEYSFMEMTARVNGCADDYIKIHETGHLLGEGARGVLTTRIAVRDTARAEVYNKLVASGAHSIGHVDCKEVIQDNAVASAMPIVEVNHPKAHVTHEAAIGSVDNKQLETLMSRGLTEEEAVDLIVEGLLS
ncbi:MAG TPA: SufD family Fe-S cluster assembly protein [Candidatus Sumerlaeia bacterium]|nr:SufD family Fe-S cluster assembly protein [Candidatus Sumerlaeia bacterium]HRR99748.1 SufD family Fe-S cluster assembly protein [Candidatus Sumerlaeia bacterium]